MNLHPTVCNLCGGRVIYTSNSRIYGKEYGSGRCYLCTCCGAYVGTHKPRPRDALGILANAEMRELKKSCHAIFGPLWQGKPKSHKKRNDLYFWLSKQMNIPRENCHFGYFDMKQLEIARNLLCEVQDMEMKYDNNGRLFFEPKEGEPNEILDNAISSF